MKTFYQIFILCYVCFVLFILFDYGEANSSAVLHRPKRFLSFLNITRFYLKINFKANMVQWNQIFAQAIGFRINWDDPPNSFHPFHRLQRRTVYNNLEILLDRNGLNGFHCVRRAVCEVAALTEPNGIYHELLKVVFRQHSSVTNKWHNTTEEGCRTSIASCPFSLLEVSRYTDII
ncbi:hypothetical protein K1T71_009143 [Dendrolimus kikuchii]|uniref:Uncharacterized protein n=1 Tax=Dendrolimus kikuchii TaxID=765133 RepID=A0ACC1CUS0_9NEOP|nr:hypothetical protein K1T71_009143 [Dendrolimus kikuchii]